MVRERHGDTLFSEDGSTVDEMVAGLLRGQRRAARARSPRAESCTGGLLAARLTDLPGSSDYVRGGVVAYSNDAKVALADVPAELIERHGAVSAEVAEALAGGARTPRCRGRRRHHRHRRTRRRHGREAGRPRVAERRDADGGGSRPG